MKTVFYKKQGRRYVPVSEYDSDFVDSHWKGSTLVVCKPGSTTRRHNIDPAFAPMAAAGVYAIDKMCEALRKASDIRMRDSCRKRQLTPGQKAAWENLVKEFGEEASQLEWPSIHETAEAGVKAMTDEVEKMMAVPAVRHAYEQFLLVWKLTKEQENE